MSKPTKYEKAIGTAIQASWVATMIAPVDACGPIHTAFSRLCDSLNERQQQVISRAPLGGMTGAQVAKLLADNR